MARRRSRRRRRGPSPLVVAAACTGAVALLGAAAFGTFAYGLPAIQAARASQPTVSTTTGAALSSPASKVVGVIIDPSGSNGGSATAVKALKSIAAILRNWAGEKPSNTGDTPGSPELDLTIRRVATNSFAASAQVTRVTLPAVPAVPPRPSDTSDIPANQAFLTQVATAEQAWAKADTAARNAASRLARATVPSERSEIAGAVSAMAQVLPASDSARHLVVISDVEQNGQPQVDGNLAGVSTTVVQRCDHGHARCQSAQDSFAQLIGRLGGDQPDFQRIEQMTSVLTSILKEQ